MVKKNASEYKTQPAKDRPPFRRDVDTPSREMLTRLIEWMEDLQEWGEQVRHDILRLEAQHPELDTGDPGPPPPPPWKAG